VRVVGPTSLASNTFEIEWPPKSGRFQTFPEVDRAEWFDLETARSKILSGQIELIDRLEVRNERLASNVADGVKTQSPTTGGARMLRA
jgi:predicted NUDIX family NTP pyrophosphohydrolase